MKNLFFVFLFCLIASTVWGANYCVTPDGTGTCGAVNATHTQVQFEALSSDYHGDTFYFSGTFSSKVDVEVYGTSAGQVVLDGYQAGDCDPINAVCSSSALLNDGMELVGGPNYVTVQDFRMTNGATGKATLQVNYAGTLGHADYLIIQRNYVYDADGTLFYLSRDSDRDGSQFVIVKNNKIVNYGGDFDATQGINIVNVSNVLLSGNEFGHDDDSFPSLSESAELMELHGCNQLLIEYNDYHGCTNQALLRPKEGNSQSDIVIRFNKLHDNDSDANQGTKQGYGIFTYGQVISPLYIYGNFIYDNIGIGIFVDPDEPSSTYIWSNLIIQNGKSYPPNGRSGIQLSAGTNYVYNNTIARNGYMDNPSYPNVGGVLVLGGTNYIKNNLFDESLPDNEYTYYHSFYESSGTFTLEHNTYNHSLSTDHFYYDSAKRNLAYMQGEGFEDDAPAGVVEDPTFTNPDGTDTTHGTDDDDYTLQTGSPSIDDGVDLSGYFDVDFGDGDSWFETNTGYESPIRIYLDEALNPSTVDWEGDAKDLADNAGNFTVMQDNWGAAWERGAYAYPTSGLTVTVTATDATATEKDTTTGEWTIACSPNCAGETINFSYSGTATIDTDYDTDDETGDVVINGASTTITLTPVDDSAYDPGEVAILTITSGTGYAIGSPSQASISIVDDDSSPAAGNPQGQATLDPDGSGGFVYSATGTGGWTR